MTDLHAEHEIKSTVIRQWLAAESQDIDWLEALTWHVVRMARYAWGLYLSYNDAQVWVSEVWAEMQTEGRDNANPRS